MKHSHRLLVLAIAVVVASACDTGTGPPADGELLLRTDSDSYVLQSDAFGLGVDIPYAFENRTGGAVYLVNCNGAFAYRLERWEDGGWSFAWGPVLPECLSPPIVIAHGTSFADTARVWGGFPSGNVYPRWDTSNPTGLYRIVWIDALTSFQDHLPFGEQIPLEYRVSNVFRLDVE